MDSDDVVAIRNGFAEEITKRWENALTGHEWIYNTIHIGLPPDAPYEQICIWFGKQQIMVDADGDFGNEGFIEYCDPDALEKVLAIILALFSTKKRIWIVGLSTNITYWRSRL